MTAAHILVCLIKDGKSCEEIAREDFDNNLELGRLHGCNKLDTQKG
jgi:hypothetical protein